MGKFSVNSIRGNENGKVRLGEGLLNDASKDIIKIIGNLCVNVKQVTKFT